MAMIISERGVGGDFDMKPKTVGDETRDMKSSVGSYEQSRLHTRSNEISATYTYVFLYSQTWIIASFTSLPNETSFRKISFPLYRLLIPSLGAEHRSRVLVLRKFLCFGHKSLCIV